MATLSFLGTERKVFTPVSSALGALSSGPGTMIVLVKQTTTGAQDFCGLTASAFASFYHGLISGTITANTLGDDDDVGSVAAAATWPQDTTNWYLVACDWSSAAAPENFRWRNQTTLGAWTTSASATNANAAKAGPGTGGFFTIGYLGDGSTGAKIQALVAVWNVRFSTSDYNAAWNKTSDLWTHPLGPPIFLTQLNSATPTDLAGGSTYSSANSTGTALTGADPDNWTFDGVGSAVARPLDPQILWDERGPGDFGPNPFVEDIAPVTPDVVTALSGSDSGTGTDAGTVSATVPGADTAAGADAGAVAATLPDSDSATGTDTAAVSATFPGSDSAAGTDAGTASATGSGSDTGSGADAGGVAATLADSDSGTGTDAQVSIVSPVSGSDSATGTEDAAASVAAPGSDSGTGTENAVATATDPGGEAGAGFDAGTVSATVPGSDAGAGTDAGTVEDVTGGPTLVSGSDSGAAADAGLVVDVTPAPVPVEDEDLGDISTEDRRRKTGRDSGRSEERAWVVDLTPRPRLEPPRVLLPARRAFLRVQGRDEGAASETARIVVFASGAESGRAVERDRGETLGVLDPAVEAEDEAMALRLLGVDL